MNDMNDMKIHEHPQHGGWFASKIFTWVLLGFLAIGAFFLIMEHTAHLLGILPFLIFLLCPLMMLFMMHDGHGNYGDHSEHDPQRGHDEQPPEGGQR